MIKRIHILLAVACVSLPMNAQDQQELKYRRSSIYSMMVKHVNQDFAEDISKVFIDMPTPDKYNNHDLSVKVVSVPEKKLDENSDITSFLKRHVIGSRLVARWFNRDIITGKCDMELVKERGLYNANEFDKELARHSQRGNALLEDAGEDLIGNTFVLVNDIRYIDRSKGSSIVGSILRIGGSIMDIANGGNTNYSENMESLAQIAESYKGFKVKIHTFLYRLVWEKETANKFYRQYYAVGNDEEKRLAFDKNRELFTLEYVGEQESSGSNVSFMGINEDEPLLMVRKACQRALDENVANLQKNFDVFKVKIPLTSTDPITAPIGMKEGLSLDSKFEVLEITTDEDGRTTYKRVGTIKPVKNKIWDNRFMAKEEKATGAELGHTTFEKSSGGKFYPGMLIREIK